jgi:signal transduction histidine kinase
MEGTPVLKNPLCFLVMVFALHSTALYSQAAVGGKATAGVADLMHDRPSADHKIRLDGEWRFFWQRFVTPEQFLNDVNLRHEALVVKVPSSWHTVRDDATGQTLGSKGYGSYLLELRNLKQLERQFGPLGLFLEYGFVNSRVYLFSSAADVRTLMVNGSPATTREESVPFLLPTVADIDGLSDATYYLLIHVSSFDHQKGGLRNSPVISNAGRLERELQIDRLISFFLIGIILIIGFWNITLFLQRHEDTGSLFLAFFCFVLAGRSFSTSHFYEFFLLQPSAILFEFSLKIEYLAHVWGACCFGSFLVKNFPKYFHQGFIRALWILGGLITLVTAMTTASFYSPLLPVFQIFAVAPSCYYVFGIVRASMNKEDGALLSLGGMVILLFGIVHDVLHGVGIIRSVYLLSFTMVVFILFQSQIVGHLFALAFRRSEWLVKELKQREKTITALNEDLKKHIENLDALVEEKTRDIKSILKNIRQGIFTILPNGQIGHDYSPYLGKIFSYPQFDGLDAMAVITKGAHLNADEKSRLVSAVASSLDAPDIAFELNRSHLVSELVYQADDAADEEKILEVDWEPIVNEDENVEKILVAVRNVTEVRTLQRKAAGQAEDLRFIGEILNVPEAKFSKFLATGQQYIAENRRLINSTEVNNQETLKIMFINMHTLKGMGRCYEFKDLTALIHTAEQKYVVLRSDPSWPAVELHADLDKIEQVLSRMQKLAVSKLNRSSDNAGSYKISQQQIEENLTALTELIAHATDKDEKQALINMERKMCGWCYREAKEIVSELFAEAPKLAKDLGKEQPLLDIKDQGFLFSPRASEVLSGVFTHLIRNSLDHGIEEAAERLQKGKTPYGTIFIELEEIFDQLRLRFYDDGRGLNIKRLYQYGIAKDLIDKDCSIDKICRLIFVNGLSTASAVSDISGRGVGMSAVKQFLEQSGGMIDVVPNSQTAPGAEYCSFEFHIWISSGLYRRVDVA